jgi:hypothetical protein
MHVWLIWPTIFAALGCAYNASPRGCSPANIEWRAPKTSTALFANQRDDTITYNLDGAVYDLRIGDGKIDRLALTPDGTTELARWPNPGLEPDGVLYLLTQGRAPSCCDSDVYLFDRSTGRSVPVTRTGRGKEGLKVSPDGKRAVYLQAGRRTDSIYIPLLSLKDWVDWRLHILDLSSWREKVVPAVRSQNAFRVYWNTKGTELVAIGNFDGEEERIVRLSAETGDPVGTLPTEFPSISPPKSCQPWLSPGVFGLLPGDRLLLSAFCSSGGPGTRFADYVIVYDPRTRASLVTHRLEMGSLVGVPFVSEDGKRVYLFVESRSAPGSDLVSMQIWTLDLSHMDLHMVAAVGILHYNRPSSANTGPP